MIADFDLSAVRLSYEWTTSVGAQKVVEFFAAKLGLEGFVFEEISSAHHKIGTNKNDEFAERFRAENRVFMDDIDAQRAEMLSYLGNA